MNIVDKNFYELINLLKQMNTEEIYENIKTNYMKVHPDTRKSIEKFVNDFKYWGKLDSFCVWNYFQLYAKHDRKAFHTAIYS